MNTKQPTRRDLLPRSRKGDVNAQFELACLYDFDPPKDRKRAFSWYMKAAKGGHAEAQNFLAQMLKDGVGCRKDAKHGIKWSRRAAEQGNSDAQVGLGYGLFYGSGLPFGPPNNDDFRNYYKGEAYQRVDIGFSKMILFDKGILNSLWISAEVLNLLGSDNTISYIWIRDFQNRQYAVPNALSARFLNLKVITRY